VWEEVLFEDLKEVINGAAISAAADRWCWRSENNAEFTVKSAYSLVFNLSNLVVLESQWYGRLFSAIWKSPTPSKVVVFVWQMLHNRILTLSNLVSRSIIAASVDSLCPLCGEEIETVTHVLLYCCASYQVWITISVWLKAPFSFPHNMFSIFNELRSASNPKGRLMICCTVVWTLWNFRILLCLITAGALFQNWWNG
jgi:hypothetical protein